MYRCIIAGLAELLKKRCCTDITVDCVMKCFYILLSTRKPGMSSINMSRKSSHSFGNRSIRTIGGGSRSNMFASSSRKSVLIDSTRLEKNQTKPPVQVSRINIPPVTHIDVIKCTCNFRFHCH